MLAGLLRHCIVGWSGIVDRNWSSFDLKGMTDLVVVSVVSLTLRGRRLNILAPLTARLASLALLT